MLLLGVSIKVITLLPKIRDDKEWQVGDLLVMLTAIIIEWATSTVSSAKKSRTQTRHTGNMRFVTTRGSNLHSSRRSWNSNLDLLRRLRSNCRRGPTSLAKM